MRSDRHLFACTVEISQIKRARKREKRHSKRADLQLAITADGWICISWNVVKEIVAGVTNHFDIVVDELGGAGRIKVLGRNLDFVNQGFRVGSFQANVAI